MAGVLVPLDVLAEIARSHEPISARDLTRNLKIGRATVYRVLAQLEEAGWIAGTGSPKAYSPSVRLMEFGVASLAQLPIREVLLAGALRLAELTGHNVLVSVPDGRDVVYLERTSFRGGRPSLVALAIRFPAIATAPGKALLAALPHEQMEALTARPVRRLTSETITDPEAQRAEVERTRERGFGVADGEAQEGASGAAMVVFDSSGTPVASLSVGGTGLEPDEAILVALREVTEQVSIELGYRPPVRHGVG